jgi:ribose 5-phosphate isomerase A
LKGEVVVSSDEQGATSSAAPSPETLREWKRAAALAAVATVPDGAVIGLGSGSTAELMVEELAARVRDGLRVTGIPSSERIRALAAERSIPLAELNAVDTVTLSIDGADEVALPRLDLVKGRGGALLHEKLVAGASHYRIIIVDASKLASGLLARHQIPVEVEPFGWRHTAGRLVALGARPTLRLTPGADAASQAASPYVTDGGHYILDCAFGPIAQPELLAAQLKTVLGVVEHGLFVGMTERVYAGGPNGVHRYDRQG